MNNANVNMDNVEFINGNTDSYWTRDYGPWWVVDGNNDVSVVDHTYNRPRPNDNQAPLKLSNHLNAYKDSHDSLGKTIRTVVNHFNKSSKEFNKIDKDIIKISSGKSTIGFEEDSIDTPQLNG